MMGEFFIRYDNMEFDDHNEHNDTFTRIIALVLFLTGICIECSIIGYYTVIYITNSRVRSGGGYELSQQDDIEASVHMNPSDRDEKHENENQNSNSKTMSDTSIELTQVNVLHNDLDR